MKLDFKMAHGEHLLREWEYGRGRKRFSATLILTNMRIISYSRSSGRYDCSEILLGNVKSIHGERKRAISGFFSVLGVVLEIMLGIALICVGLGFILGGPRMQIILGPWSTILTILFLPSILLGILLLVHAIIRLRRSEVRLVIATKGGEGTPLAVGKTSDEELAPRTKFKIAISNSVFDDICQTIGALVLDMKNEAPMSATRPYAPLPAQNTSLPAPYPNVPSVQPYPAYGGRPMLPYPAWGMRPAPYPAQNVYGEAGERDRDAE